MAVFYSEQTIYTSPDETLHLTSTKNKQKAKLPPFQMIGREHTMTIKGKQVLKGYPVIDTILDMSGAEKWFYKLLKDNYDYTSNISDIRQITLSPSNQRRLSLAYTSLHKIGFIKRVKKRVYMFNPDAFIFPPNQEKNKDKWDQLP